MSLGYLVFLITWDHKGTSLITRSPQTTGSHTCSHQLSWQADRRMSHSRKHFTEGITIAFPLASDGLVIWLLQVKASSI